MGNGESDDNTGAKFSDENERNATSDEKEKSGKDDTKYQDSNINHMSLQDVSSARNCDNNFSSTPSGFPPSASANQGEPGSISVNNSFQALLDKESRFKVNPKVLIRQATTFLSTQSDSGDEEEATGSGRQNHFSFDEERLQQALIDAGTYSYGIAAVEVWELNEETGRLCRPGSYAWWTNPDVMQERSPQLSCLDDPSHPDYSEPKELMPGVDLAGKLFAESKYYAKQAIRCYASNNKNTAGFNGTSGGGEVDDSIKSTYSFLNSSVKGKDFTKMMTSSFDSRVQRTISFGGLRHVQNPTKSTPHEGKQQQPEAARDQSYAMKFRDINSLLIDPDTLKTPRLELLHEAGFVKAAGVPFNTGWQKGIVIFYTKITEDEEQHHAALTSIVNQLYLLHATENIASVLSSTESRRASMALKLFMKEQLIENKHDIENNAGGALLSLKSPTNNQDESQQTQQKGLFHYFELWWKKCSNFSCDGDSLIPPSMPWSQSALTFFGAFVALLILLASDIVIRFLSSDTYFFLAGPIGALITLQYGLTSAPASQPRNVLLAPILVGCITIPLTYVPHHILPIWIRQALATALSITAMAKLGVTHPPAGGMSIILASGNSLGWEFIIISFVGSAISVVPAIFINNLSQKRQYPTYWGFPTAKCLNFQKKYAVAEDNAPPKQIQNDEEHSAKFI